MIPIIPFALGALAGAAVIRLYKGRQHQHDLDVAKKQLKKATIDGLNALESSTARLRDKLSAEDKTSDSAAKKPAAEDQAS